MYLHILAHRIPWPVYVLCYIIVKLQWQCRLSPRFSTICTFRKCCIDLTFCIMGATISCICCCNHCTRIQRQKGWDSEIVGFCSISCIKDILCIYSLSCHSNKFIIRKYIPIYLHSLYGTPKWIGNGSLTHGTAQHYIVYSCNITDKLKCLLIQRCY